MTDVDHPFAAEAAELHRRCLVIDTHCDTTQLLMRDDWSFDERHVEGHVDIPRLKVGGVGAIFLAVYQKGPLPSGEGPAAARNQIDCIRDSTLRYPSQLCAATRSEDIRRARSEGRIAVLTAVEGGYLIDDSLDVLQEFHGLGVVYMTLTHAFHTNWADSSGVHQDLSPKHGGLTSFGRDVIRRMNRLGMIVDVSHVSDAAFWDVVETTEAPILATHSSCRAVSPHRRNLSDDMIRAIAETGGSVQINFASAFIDPDFPRYDPSAAEQWPGVGASPVPPPLDHVTPFRRLVDHFEHAVRLVGPDHVGIGSDFDGVLMLPSGMEDCSNLPRLTAELMARGFKEADLRKILGENVLRVMDACQRIASR